MQCNICGGTEFETYRARPGERCCKCGSKARHRIALDVYERLLFARARPGFRLLHLAPERFLHPLLKARFGEGYITGDASPERYPHATPVKLFLPRDFTAFPAGHFDAILHNHVLEHIPGHYKDHLNGLVEWLAPGGLMIFSVPGPYMNRQTEEGGENLSSNEERLARFLQEDHFKIFGADFVDYLHSMPRGECMSDGVTDAIRAKLSVRPAKAPFFVWQKR
ncbi:MAG: methyltransferase domain-containing protein [Rhizobiaceae bacterium]